MTINEINRTLRCGDRDKIDSLLSYLTEEWIAERLSTPVFNTVFFLYLRKTNQI
jgi:hypothetical protein